MPLFTLDELDAAMAAPILMRSAFADEVSSIVMVSQHGLPYLPMMVMETLGLVEKHAAKLGVGALKADATSMPIFGRSAIRVITTNWRPIKAPAAEPTIT